MVKRLIPEAVADAVEEDLARLTAAHADILDQLQLAAPSAFDGGDEARDRAVSQTAADEETLKDLAAQTFAVIGMLRAGRLPGEEETRKAIRALERATGLVVQAVWRLPEDLRLGRPSEPESLQLLHRVIYDPEAVRGACPAITSDPVDLDHLPDGISDDHDLLRNLDARYGTTSGLTFAQRRVPVSVLKAHLPRDHRRMLDEIEAAGTDWFDALERDWREAWAEELEDGADPSELDEDYPDGTRRAHIVRGYIADIQAGRRIPPIVLDFFNLPDGIDLLDGYHRIAAAVCAHADDLIAFELLPED